jgi:hypothetical protein
MLPHELGLMIKDASPSSESIGMHIDSTFHVKMNNSMVVSSPIMVHQHPRDFIPPTWYKVLEGRNGSFI